jgi:hypothetical protein
MKMPKDKGRLYAFASRAWGVLGVILCVIHRLIGRNTGGKGKQHYEPSVYTVSAGSNAR